MATTLSELYRLASELHSKIVELTQADPETVFVDVSVHRVGDSQVHLDLVNYFTTTQYGTETARWDGDEDFPTVKVQVYGERGQRLLLPPDPTPDTNLEERPNEKA